MDTDPRTEFGSEVLNRVREPAMYEVILHNDEVTTMDFVVELLMKVFHKKTAEAAALMMVVHERGSGVAGIYTYDIAVTKKSQSDRLSAEKGFPLKLSIREAG